VGYTDVLYRLAFFYHSEHEGFSCYVVYILYKAFAQTKILL